MIFLKIIIKIEFSQKVKVSFNLYLFMVENKVRP